MQKTQSRTSSADKPKSSTGMTDARLLKAMQVAKSISQANTADGSDSSQKTGYNGSGSKGENLKEEFEARVDISAYPREVVKVIMDKKTRIKISDMTDGATFTGRGVFVPEGKKLLCAALASQCDHINSWVSLSSRIAHKKYGFPFINIVSFASLI